MDSELLLRATTSALFHDSSPRTGVEKAPGRALGGKAFDTNDFRFWNCIWKHRFSDRWIYKLMKIHSKNTHFGISKEFHSSQNVIGTTRGGPDQFSSFLIFSLPTTLTHRQRAHRRRRDWSEKPMRAGIKKSCRVSQTCVKPGKSDLRQTLYLPYILLSRG